MEGLGQKGDCLITFSTSGNSKNIINVLKTAKKLGFSINDHSKKKINDMYEELYGIKPQKKISGDLTFKNAATVLGKRVKKNKKKFLTILKKQQKLIK